MFKEKLCLWKNNKIRTAITMTIRQAARKDKIRKKPSRSKDRKKLGIKKKLEKHL
jgi:hypothetical protein